jgi:O-antigen/teichoic acid export membrane protein
VSPWLRYLPSLIRDPLEERAYLQRVISNTGWLIVERVLRMVVGFVVGIWIARHLGVEQYGLLNYASAIVGVLAILGTLGLDPMAVREMVRHPERRNAVLGTLVAARLASGMVLVLCATAAVALLRPGDGLAAMLVLIIAVAQLVVGFDAIDTWFQANMTSRQAAGARSASFLCATLLRVGLLLAGASVTAFAWALFVEALLFAVAMVAVYSRSGLSIMAWRPSAERARALLRDGWPLILASLFAAVSLRIDQVMLGQMVGLAEVGTYAVAVRVVEVLYVVPAAIAASVFPAIIKSKELGGALYPSRIQMLYDAMLWLALAIALPLCLLAPYIVRAFFGSAFDEAGPALRVLAWMPVWVFFAVVRQRWLYAENALLAGTAVEAAACLLNVALNLVLIPRYGAVGAAAASLSSGAVASVLIAPFSPPIRESLRMFLTSATAPLRFKRSMSGQHQADR